MNQLCRVSTPAKHVAGTCRLLLADKVATTVSMVPGSYKLPMSTSHSTYLVHSPTLYTLGAPTHPPELLQSLLPTLSPFLSPFLLPPSLGSFLSPYPPSPTFSYPTPSSLLHCSQPHTDCKMADTSSGVHIIIDGFCTMTEFFSFFGIGKADLRKINMVMVLFSWHNSDDKIKAIQVTLLVKSQDKKQGTLE